MSYKKTNALMRHLRENGISINGEKQKRQLINTGYFHGYKGYRFFGDSQRKLPFKNYEEVIATIKYDSDLKTLFYGKIMFIETAVKNIALDSILVNADSECITDMYEKVVSSYNNAPSNATEEQKRKMQQNKLNLQNTIQSNLMHAYKKNNPKITHFYNNIGYSDVPIWALFEILTMGDFDTRFRNIDPTNAMKQCLKLEIGLPYVNFKTIGDYVILMCYYLKMLKQPKVEIKSFIREFERITDNYKKAVNEDVSAKVIHPDLQSRMQILKSYI